MKVLTVFLLVSYGCILAQNPDIDLEVFATGFDNPLDIKHAGDDRLFIVEQSGTIQILNSDGTINDTPFLDIAVNDGGNEQGLLGVAFHPEYATNGFFFVNYILSNGDTQVSRFSVSSDADIANPNSELELLTIDQPFTNHNGGCMQFGPDGYLYIALGDGGSGGDPGNRAQNLSLLLGKMLRIDIDNTDPGLNYAIPDDNPFINDTSALNEIWAYGLRNPWKFSFDSQTGDLWIADVGQNEIEEINRVSSSSPGGENYGWRCYEGNDPFNTSGCPDANTLTFPIAEYTHSGNGVFKCSITGGYVYRGNEHPGMEGIYVFADFCSNEMAIVDGTDTISYFGPFTGGLSAIGEDINKELYVSGLGNGNIYKVIDNNTLDTTIPEIITFSIYPNPSTDVVTFEYPSFPSGRSTGAEANQLNIYNITGKLVQTESISSASTTFSVAQLPAGIYIARMSSNPQIIKLVIR